MITILNSEMLRDAYICSFYRVVCIVNVVNTITMDHRKLQLLLIVTFLTATSGMDYYVQPDGQQQCLYKPCHTLAYYTRNVTRYFTSGAEFLFLSGTHNLNVSVPVLNVMNLTLTGAQGSGSAYNHKIQCQGLAGFYFNNVTGLSISNLSFLHCGQLLPPNDTSAQAALAMDTIIDLNIAGVIVHRSEGSGLYADNLLGNARIFNSTFELSSGSIKPKYHGGNVIIFYHNCPNTNDTHKLMIESSHFLNGFDPNFGAFANGLTLVVKCTNIKINVNNVILQGNRAFSGGNLCIIVYDITDYVTNTINVSNSLIEGGSAYKGGGVFVSIFETPPKRTLVCRQTRLLNFFNITFNSNYASEVGGALYLNHRERPEVFCNQSVHILIKDCKFMNNSITPHPYGGAVVHISNFRTPDYVPRADPQFHVEFQNCHFRNNSRNNIPKNTSLAAIYITGEPNMIITNCNFTNNFCTAIAAVHSTLLLKGKITITENRGTDGGGLFLCQASYIILFPNTSVTFSNNYALHNGGAIYAENECLHSTPACFFQLDTMTDWNNNILSTVSITMDNNSAAIAGTALYGGTVDHCYLLTNSKDISHTSSTRLFNKIFHISSQVNDSSNVSSDPQRVCFCDNKQRNCSKTTLTKLVFPGETFTIWAVVVGQRNGAVPGDVLAKTTNASVSLGPLEDVQTIDGIHCTELNYTIFSNQTEGYVNLTAQQPNANSIIQQQHHPPQIHAQLRDCPLGFMLTGVQHPSCQCVHTLNVHGVTCYISTQAILRPKSAWIGYKKENSSGGKKNIGVIAYHKRCPLNYCKDYALNVSLTDDTDEQCAANRTGILCGACQNGYSLTLGASQCTECSSYYTLLVPAFALAGIALVLLLIICNLTVSEGTLSGLIFYANIVHINSDIFFPPPHITNTFLVPIAWLNLDLGIKTCFYDGMDAYIETWLQFVFPVYVWIIAGMIIFLSRKYNTVTRLIGRNGIQVLATLFFLSYAKLLQTIIVIFYSDGLTFTTADGSHSFNTRVWTYDGNIEFLHGKHIPLFIAALLFAIVTLPYAVVLLFVQCLRRRSNLKILFWVTKLKPLFDAYTGPYKDRYQFWTGLLLLARIVLFLGYSISDVRTNPLLTILVCSSVLTLAWALRGVYKKRPLDVLESSFFLNLLVLSASTASSSGYQEVIMYASILIAYTTLIGILIYHAIKAAKKLPMLPILQCMDITAATP